MKEETEANMTVVMYQAFKIPEAFNQVIFSVLTLFHELKGDFTQIHPVIYTDDAARLSKYFPAGLVSLIEVKPEALVDYAGPLNYFHRIRHFLIRDCFAQFKTNLLYVDGDTFFLQSPKALVRQINDKTSIMHTREFSLAEGGDFEGINWLKIRKLVRDNVFRIKGQDVKIPYSTTMWNAGVLGIDYRNRDSIDDTIELMDQSLPVASIFNIEQLAIGFNLQRHTEIKPAEDYIYHYWPADLKKAYNRFINSFLVQNGHLGLPELAALAYEASRQKDKLPRVKPTFLDKVKLRLSLIKQVAMKGSL
ncbi:MAG: hypothetical protein JWQ14_282 [Adhaeribacter sp.]|jgi:hypothetical protein|nr:hypothetical protein [Adhaeribacter sp.]